MRFSWRGFSFIALTAEPFQDNRVRPSSVAPGRNWRNPFLDLKVIMKQQKRVWSVFFMSSASLWLACTAGDPPAPGSSGTTTIDPTTTQTTTENTSSIDPTTTISTDPTTTEDTAEPECTVDGVCVCIKLASWGALGAYGAEGGTGEGQDAIVAWLNENSTGDADYFLAKPALTAEALGVYDVILIQDISMWTAFTPDEKATFEAWVRAGGGVITLNGYSANNNEMANVNDLLGFTGLSYVPASDTANETQRATKLGVCEDCYGASVPQEGWTTHPIGLNMKQVGAFHGRAVMGGTPVAAEFGSTLGATAEVDLGHVFMFHDEWVTYNSQWTGAGLPTDCSDPQYSANGQCLTEHPLEQYTIPQFWYNSILWTSGAPECFVIDDDTIIR